LDIHHVLEAAAKALSIDTEVPFMRAAADFSQRTLEDATRTLAETFAPSDDLHLDVVVLGSVARREASEASDFDFLVIAHGLPADVTATRDLLKTTFDIQTKSQMNEPNPGGLFGRVVSAPELTEKVGLQLSTNPIFTTS
jgi:predicted nucleotidyltransferase